MGVPLVTSSWITVDSVLFPPVVPLGAISMVSVVLDGKYCPLPEGKHDTCCLAFLKDVSKKGHPVQLREIVIRYAAITFSVLCMAVASVEFHALVCLGGICILRTYVYMTNVGNLHHHI